MQRILVQLLRGGDLHELAEVHHRDPIGDVPHDREIVGDDEKGEPEPLLERHEEVDHLGLDRDIQRRDGLVGDEHRRVERKGPREADALPLTAGELVRIPVVVLGREPDGRQHLLDALPPDVAVSLFVDRQRRPDDRADPLTGIQARVRVLEDDLQLAPERP